MRLAVFLLFVTGALAIEVASVDAFGRIDAMFYRGETLKVSTNVNIDANGRDAGLSTAERVRVERDTDGGGNWRGSLNGFAFEQAVQGSRVRLRMSAERDMASAKVSFQIALPRQAFAGGVVNGKVPLATVRSPGEKVAAFGTSQFEASNGTLRFRAALDRARSITVHDLWVRGGRWYIAVIELHRGAIAKGTELSFEAALQVEGEPDISPARVTLNASKPRYRFHGFGGNYCFNTESPVTAYTLENLRSAWARVEMNSREWEPENDDASPETTNWAALKARDVEGTKLHRDFLLARQIQQKKIPYAISVWRLPEWLYSDPNQQPASAHRRRVPPEKWQELLEHIGSYLTYAKEQYGVEPDLFSFNEANIGVNVLFTPEEHREAIKSIGSHMKKLRLKTKMLLGDATGPRDTHLWALAAANDAEALEHAGAVSFHSWEGGTPEQYAAWGDLAEWLQLPLLVAEVGVDAFAWRNRTYDTFHYGMREVQMYQELLLHARPQGFLQWEYTGDYGLARTIKNADGTVDVEPTARFWFLKQFSELTPMHSEALETASDNAKVLFTAFSGSGTLGAHLANLGAQREITISGIPNGVTSLRAVRTSETEFFKEIGAVAVKNGVTTLLVPSRCLVTLTTAR